MKRPKWDAKTKATIVLEGRKGEPVATVCQDYQIRQAQDYQWRDQFLANAPKAFVRGEKRYWESFLRPQGSSEAVYWFA